MQPGPLIERTAAPSMVGRRTLQCPFEMSAFSLLVSTYAEVRALNIGDVLYRTKGRAAVDKMLADRRGDFVTGLSETASSRVPCKRTMPRRKGGSDGGGGKGSGSGRNGGKSTKQQQQRHRQQQLQQKADPYDAALAGGTEEHRSPLDLYLARVQPGCQLALKCQEQGAAAVGVGVWTPAHSATLLAMCL